MNKIIEVCPHCGREFILGENGTIDGCDDCIGAKRDKRGHFWMPDEDYHVQQSFNNPNLYFWIKRPKEL